MLPAFQGRGIAPSADGPGDRARAGGQRPALPPRPSRRSRTRGRTHSAGSSASRCSGRASSSIRRAPCSWSTTGGSTSAADGHDDRAGRASRTRAAAMCPRRAARAVSSASTSRRQHPGVDDRRGARAIVRRFARREGVRERRGRDRERLARRPAPPRSGLPRGGPSCTAGVARTRNAPPGSTPTASVPGLWSVSPSSSGAPAAAPTGGSRRSATAPTGWRRVSAERPRRRSTSAASPGGGAGSRHARPATVDDRARHAPRRTVACLHAFPRPQSAVVRRSACASSASDPPARRANGPSPRRATRRYTPSTTGGGPPPPAHPPCTACILAAGAVPRRTSDSGAHAAGPAEAKGARAVGTPVKMLPFPAGRS